DRYDRSRRCTGGADRGERRMTGPELKPIPSAPADFGTDSAGPAGTEPGRWHGVFRRVVMGNGLISVLSVVLALIAGSIMIAFTDPDVQRTAGYFFARPQDMLSAVWSS